MNDDDKLKEATGVVFGVMLGVFAWAAIGFGLYLYFTWRS